MVFIQYNSNIWRYLHKLPNSSATEVEARENPFGHLFTSAPPSFTSAAEMEDAATLTFLPSQDLIKVSWINFYLWVLYASV